MTSIERAPQNWPSTLKYLVKPEYAAKLRAATIKLLSPNGTSSTHPSSTKIKQITDEGHPAYGQFGLFAGQDLKAGTHIVDYLGFYHNPEDSDPTSDYDLSLRHESIYIGIDAAKMGNEARMLNDYRGVKDKANAKFDSYVNPNGEVRMGVFVMGSNPMDKKSMIRKGDEILVSYGKSFWQNRDNATEISDPT